MGKLFIFCDESTDKGAFYSNFFGGVLVKGEHIGEVKKSIEQFIVDNGFTAEIKWSNINLTNYQRYIQFLDVIFGFVQEDKLKIRIFFSQNSRIPQSVTHFEPELKFTKLYYQFLKHAFGLKYCNEGSGEKMEIFIALDELPVNSFQKQAFRTYLSSISTQADFLSANLSIKTSNVSEYSSKNEVFGQVIDIVLGAIQFRLNKKHEYRDLAKPRTIPKKTKAKLAVYEHLNKLLREIRPYFNIGENTGQDGNLKNKWHHSYRHWSFKAHSRGIIDFDIDPPPET